MGIFKFIVPLHQRAVIGVTPHQLDRFGYYVDSVRTAQSNAVLCLQPKDAFHRYAALFIVCSMQMVTKWTIDLSHGWRTPRRRDGSAIYTGSCQLPLQSLWLQRHQITPVARARASDTAFTGEIFTTFSGS